MSADRSLQRLWYESRPRWLLVLMLPLSLLFLLAVYLRRALYRMGLMRMRRLSRPVIVVGNLTAGGTGKTPFVIWLTEYLQQHGLKVGVVLRGYGGISDHWPRVVDAATTTREVGDEAVLHFTRTGAIVVAAPDRVAAAARAIDLGAQVVVADDGLQHYALARDVEIAVMDAQRSLGNGFVLPAGPLREPASRLNSVNLIVRTHRSASAVAAPAGHPRTVAVRTRLEEIVALKSGERRPLSQLRGQRVHAVAGIGNPQAFFAALSAAGLIVNARALPDHATIAASDILFSDGAPVLMTEKDAVKCRGFAGEQHWFVPMTLDLDAQARQTVTAVLGPVLAATKSS